MNSYSNAVRRACKRAKIPQWHVYQLRHNVATRIKKAYDKDVVRALLGHIDGKSTDVYIEKFEADCETARELMRRIG